jgi:hypothetical protein
MLLLLAKLLVYGHLGLLIEVWFTGIHGLIFKRDLRMKAVTYLPMLVIYGVTALVLEGVSEALPWPFYLKAFVYVLIIFCAEASSGWLLKHLTGRIPWDYGQSKWTPMGLINLKYIPYWLILAMCFDSITAFLTKLLQAVALVT